MLEQAQDQAKELIDECLKLSRGKMTFPAVKQNEAIPHLLNSIECIARPFADTFMEFFKENSQLLHLFFQEQTGSSKPCAPPYQKQWISSPIFWLKP